MIGRPVHQSEVLEVLVVHPQVDVPALARVLVLKQVQALELRLLASWKASRPRHRRQSQKLNSLLEPR